MIASLAAVQAPTIDFAGLSPIVALLGGAIVVLLVGLLPGKGVHRWVVPLLTLAALGAALGLTVWQFGPQRSIIAGALAVDDLAMALNLVFIVAAAAAVLLAWREPAPAEVGVGEHHALLLSAVAGMAILAGAQNTVTLFLGLELLSIALYVLCATELRRSSSLESGLKYLVVGSVGSATLLYGLALLYGSTSGTNFATIARGLSEGADAMALTGIALVVAGLAFKASIAPFHQWTPDVYQGAPTPITAFMAVATKAAAFGILLRFFDVALIDAALAWGPALAVLAAVSIVVGNVGALGQSSLKRLLAWSSVAQAGYLLAGVVVATELGVRAVVFYLAVYLVMNLAAFAVVVARERQTGEGDHISTLDGLGASHPWLAWPMTLAMLGLAGIPATAGFVGKFYLIDAAVSGGFAWLAVMIVIGSMISLAYYLRVVGVMWLSESPASSGFEATSSARAGGPAGRPAMAGGSPEVDPRPAGAETVALAVVFGAGTLALGIVPSPLMDLARAAGAAVGF